MIGKCPNCGINLKEPPFGNRDTNEVMLTLKYRDYIENNKDLASVEKKGYCMICNAEFKDLETQKRNNKLSNRKIC